MVAVEAPFALFIAGGQKKVSNSLPSEQEPFLPSGQPLGETSFCRLGNKRGSRGLHSYCTGPPRLPHGTSNATRTGPPRLQRSNFWRRKMRKSLFWKVFFNVKSKHVQGNQSKTLNVLKKFWEISGLFWSVLVWSGLCTVYCWDIFCHFRIFGKF